MSLYLSMQSTYEQVEIAVFKDKEMLASSFTHKFNASSELILAINNLLLSSSLCLSDLDFIAINQGPGPFTTLRVAIATINGINFASGIPLVGVQGLPAFAEEFHTTETPVTVALLNAFNKDLYYAIAQESQEPVIGVENYQTLFSRLHELFPQTHIQFIGNGVTLFKNELVAQFSNCAIIPEPVPEFPSIEQIGKKGLIQWQKKQGIVSQIQPDYIKNYSAIIRYS